MPGMGRSVRGADRGAVGSGSAFVGPPGSTWSDAGLAELTGRADRPGLGPPPGLVPGVHALAGSIARHSSRIGRTVDVDPLELMADRARSMGLGRNGPVSCGGSTRLLPARDDWMAVSLSRPSDWDLVPAWLGLPTGVDAGDWAPVARAVAGSTTGELLDRSAGLGLPVARVGERRHRPPAPGGTADGIDGIVGIACHRLGATSRPPADAGDLVVADLSALWAGPLVGAVLVGVGARVVKVESTTRPDSARVGSPRHFAGLDRGKEPVTVDLTTQLGRTELHGLVDGADVVITSARPRALEQLGLRPADAVRTGRPRVWVMVTGYGTDPGSADRVAFGDDAAAAGGLVVRDDRGPCFCADAVADPVTGLAASAAVLRALADGGEHLLVASMADVAGGLVDGPGAGASAGARPATGVGPG